MSENSPLESLAAFAIAFVVGILSALGLSGYIQKIKKSKTAPPFETDDEPISPTLNLSKKGNSLMPLKCPVCGSKRTVTNNYGKKAGCTIGTVAGAAGGAVGVLGGAELGAMVGIVAGPPGMAIGMMTGAIIAALMGGAAGAAAGTALGEVIDETVLDNHRCLECHHTFSRPPRSEFF